jgi:lysophospholipase L1-like esterase
MSPKLWWGIGLLAASFFITRKRKFRTALVVGDSLSSLPNAMGGEMQRLLNEKGIPTERVFKSGKGTLYFIGEESSRKVRPSPITRALREHKPELLVVILGANDFRLGLAEGDWRPFGLRRKGPIAPREAMYKKALREFVTMAKNAGTKKIIWIGPSKHEDDPRPGRTHKHGTWSNPAAIQIAKWQKDTLQPLGVTWYDSQAMTRDLNTKDGIHFYPPESKLWAARAAELIFETVTAV